jgi:tRNA-2-methylthio-N6-dimethylallyladenosine synthase
LVQLRSPRAAASATAPSAAVSAVTDGATAARLVYIETYGCQMNVADTDMALGLLHADGYARTEDPARADLIPAQHLRRPREGRRARVSRGPACWPRRRRVPVSSSASPAAWPNTSRTRSFTRAPYVDSGDRAEAIAAWWSTSTVPAAPGARVWSEKKKPGAGLRDTTLDRFETYEGLDPARAKTGGLTDGVTGHVTIQRGCDKFCTFCVVPLHAWPRARHASARGPAPVRALADAGYKEIQLLGQTVNSYQYEDVGFAALLRAVAAVDGIERVRFTRPTRSISPTTSSARSPRRRRSGKARPHLPLQTASGQRPSAHN